MLKTSNTTEEIIGEDTSIMTQCGKCSIFLSFSFYVKSILENAKVKECHFCNFRGPEFWILVPIFQSLENAKIHEKNQNSESLNVFGPVVMKLISRKI